MKQRRLAAAAACVGTCVFALLVPVGTSAQPAPGGAESTPSAPPAEPSGSISAPAEPTVEPTPAPDQPAPPEAGVPEAPPAIAPGVNGVVLDSRTREPMIEATVQVVGASRRTVTDVDGRFHLALPPGTYTLRSFYELYRPARVEHVTVRAGESTPVEILLTPDDASVQEVVVTARADRSTAATQLQIRRQAATVQDAVSAQEIARSPDSTASDAVRRVVAATIVDGQYLFVRGLGGRYTNVLLNGAPLPSTDPDLPGVQLDLFPAHLLDSLTIVKTFTPDLPADFTGGLMAIDTRNYPERFTFQVNAGVGLNSESSLRRGLRYDGGGLDALGFDDGTRALPSSVPNARLAPGRDGMTPESVATVARSFENTWNVRRATTLPDLSLGATVGDGTTLFRKPFGYLFSFGYQLQTRRSQETLRRLSIGEGSVLGVAETLSQEATTQNALWGVLGTMSLTPARNHELTLVTLYNRSSSDYTGFLSGVSEQEGVPIAARRLRFVERGLFFTQLLGDHRGLPLDARLRWQAYASLVSRNEPDTRDVLYQEGPLGFGWKNSPGSGERFFGELSQVEGGGTLSLSIPVATDGRIAIGGAARASDRDFTARRFAYEYIGATAADRYLAPEVLFGPDRIGTTTQLVERTNPADGYSSQTQLYAGYAMLDLPLVSSLRAVAGARVESYHQALASSSPFALESSMVPEATERTDVDVLPAAALVLGLSSKMAIRAAYGATVARPQARELAPFLFADFVRRRTVQGNPDLERTYIHNVDLRWELFPSDGEVIAASLFYKSFLHPIEQTILDTNGNITFENVDGATNFGAELEGRLSLGRITDALDAFSVGANLTLVRSRVSLSAEQRSVATTDERALAGQSPWVANLSLGFSPRDSGLSVFAYYNVYGPRIQDVGSLGLPDVYEEPVHQVDATVSYAFSSHLTVKLALKNLLFSRVVLSQGHANVREYDPGTSASLRLTWSY